MSAIDCTPAPGAATPLSAASRAGVTLHVDLSASALGDRPERFVVRAVARLVAELRRVSAGAGDRGEVPVTIALRVGQGAPEPFVAALFEAARGLSQVATIERLGVRCNVLLADAGGLDDLERSIAFLGSSRAAFVTGVSLDLRAQATA